MPRAELSERVLVGAALSLIAAAYVLAGLVGLPLFGDGAYYYLKVAVDHEPVVPNLRYAALLPQLPGAVAALFTDDALWIRHAFALGYAALPVASLAGSWLLCRRRAPALLLLPALSLLALQINFSSVSELLASLYLSWPVLLAAVLYPQRRAARLAVLLAGPLLLLLHPLAFLPALLLAGTSWLLARACPPAAGAWRGLALWLAATAALRILWTLLGANDYERSVLAPDAALSYLLPSTLPQRILLAAVALAALLAVRQMLREAAGRVADAGSARWTLAAFLLLPLLAAGTGWEMILGHGIKLKAAISVGIGLGLLGLALVVGLLRHVPGAAPVTGRGFDAPRLLSACAAAVVVLVLAKSAAWWTGTRGLQNLVAEPGPACIEFGPETPYALQWRWMAIVDDWATPLNALAFRPRELADQPIALLLPDDGCRIAAETGRVFLASWLERPLASLNARFGPLRAAREARGGD